MSDNDAKVSLNLIGRTLTRMQGELREIKLTIAAERDAVRADRDALVGHVNRELANLHIRIDGLQSNLDARFEHLNERLDMAEEKLNERLDRTEAKLNDRLEMTEAKLNKRLDRIEALLLGRQS